MNNIFEMADELRALKDRKDELKAEEKDVNKRIEQVEQELVAAMVEEETDKFTRAGKTFYLNTRFYARAIPALKQDLYQTLKDEGYGDLVYETVNANSLSAFVKELREENMDEMPDWLDGLVDGYEKTTIGMRKA